MSFVYSSLDSGNQSLFAGALLGLNQREVVLSHEEVQDFYSATKREVYLENFRQVISPIQLLVSMAYLLEDKDRQELISYCQELNSAFSLVSLLILIRIRRFLTCKDFDIDFLKRIFLFFLFSYFYCICNKM